MISTLTQPDPRVDSFQRVLQRREIKLETVRRVWLYRAAMAARGETSDLSESSMADKQNA